MDLDKRNFPWKLSDLFEQLLHADFIALDFELSGIPSKLAQTAEEHLSQEARQGRTTLQERYEETKAAAEKYHILQIGITIAEQSSAHGGYTLRPYNMPLNPCVLQKMEIDREITLLGSSMQFLLSVNFEVQAPFLDGVPYLSRIEQRRAIQLESERLDRCNVPDIRLDSDDHYHKEFVQKVRRQIKTWEPRSNDDSLIVDAGSGVVRISLDAFQRRLVHQLVRAEFPKYVSVTMGGVMKILTFQAERENKIKKQKMDAFKQKVSKQVGFRWFLEALVGGDISDVDPADLYMKPEGPSWLDISKAKGDLAELGGKLKQKRPVIVGHNLFLDLVYLYKTFFGDLPAKVEDFAKSIHALFPLIVDTKYLATHHGVMHSSSLEELAAEVHDQPRPQIYTQPGHQKYEHTSKAHEAGFDSWQTARVLIKSAAKLASTPNWKEQLKVSSPGGPQQNLKLIDIDDPEVPQSPLYKDTAAQARADHLNVETNTKVLSTLALARDLLALLPKPVEPEAADPHRLQFPKNGKNAAIPKWIPAWSSDFWLVYGNKVRVNGTKEGVLDFLPI